MSKNILKDKSIKENVVVSLFRDGTHPKLETGYARNRFNEFDGFDQQKTEIVKYHLEEGDLRVLRYCASRINGESTSNSISGIISICYRIFSKHRNRERFTFWTLDEYGAQVAIDIWSIDCELEPNPPVGFSSIRTTEETKNRLVELVDILGTKSSRIAIRHCVRTLGVLLDLLEKGYPLNLYDRTSQSTTDYHLPLTNFGPAEIFYLLGSGKPGESNKDGDNQTQSRLFEE